MSAWTLRKARKLLPQVLCGNARGHKRHVWEDRRERSEHRFELVFCDGVPETKAERFERKLRSQIGAT